MWSFFSRDPLKDLPYELGEKVDLPGYEEKSIWSLHNGKKKSNGDPVSIFAFDVKNASEAQVQVAKAAFKRLKTMRHPNILTYIDGVETDKSVCIVTEPVVPLETYLQNNSPDVTGPNQLAVSWGLHQLAKALSFLTGDCALIHNNVCTASVFVDKAGEWKLGGVDYMYPITESAYGIPVKILPALEKYDPPEKSTKKPSEKWSTDMWCLGCLIWEVFNGSFAKTTALKTLGKIPKSLVSQYCELVGANPKSRPSPMSFIESCRATGGFMDNKFVSAMLFLEEIQIKDQEAKNQFFNSLSGSLDSFPVSFCTQKILPLLIHAYEYGNAGSAVLTPMFKLGKLLETEDYQKRIVPCVVKLFSSTDRATRVKLLQQIEHFVEHLTPSVVNDQIFPSIVTGFMDSNPIVREQTIKSMLHLAGKLNYKNLNEELLKHFARLQSRDDQGGIRTNTTVCLGKIACHLHPQVRQRVLSSAYLRSIKDPFPPARQAGILAMAATHNFFTLQESAVRLLPALCTLTMDPDKTVRDQAFRAIKCYLGKLEKVSENPDLMAEAEKDVNTGGTSASGTAGWTGWAVSGMTSITSKIYRGGSAGGKAAAAKPKPAAAAIGPAAASKPVETGSAGNVNKAVQENKPVVKEEDEEEEEEQEQEQDIWDDAENWGEMEKVDSTGPSQATSRGAAQSTNQSAGNGWDDDGAWDSIEDDDDTATSAAPAAASASSRLSHTPSESPGISSKASLSSSSIKPSPAGARAAVDDGSSIPASAYNWNQQPSTNDDDFFNSLIDSKPAARKPQSSLSLSSQSQKSSAVRGAATSTSSTSKLGSKPSGPASNKGWDDWGNDEWGEDNEWDQDSSNSSGRGGKSRGKPAHGSRT